MCKHDNHTQPRQNGNSSRKGRRRKQSPEEEALSHFTEDWQKAFDLDFVPELWFGQKTSRVEWDASKRRPLTLDLLCQILNNGLDEATEGELGPHALEFLSRLGYATPKWEANTSLGQERVLITVFYKGLVDGSMSGSHSRQEWSDLSLWVPRGPATRDWLLALKDLEQDPSRPDIAILQANRKQLEAILAALDPENSDAVPVVVSHGLLPQEGVYGGIEEDLYCPDCAYWGYGPCYCYCPECGGHKHDECGCEYCECCELIGDECNCTEDRYTICRRCGNEFSECTCIRCSTCGRVEDLCNCNVEQAEEEPLDEGDESGAAEPPVDDLLNGTDGDISGYIFSKRPLKPPTLAQLILLLEESGLLFDAIKEYNEGAGMDITKENWSEYIRFNCQEYPQLVPYIYKAIKHCDWIPES